MSYISFYFYFVPFSYSFLADVVHTPRPYLEQLLSITVGDQGLILESEGSDPIENLSSPARGPTQSITFKFRFHPYCFGNLWSFKKKAWNIWAASAIKSSYQLWFSWCHKYWGCLHAYLPMVISRQRRISRSAHSILLLLPLTQTEHPRPHHTLSRLPGAPLLLLWEGNRQEGRGSPKGGNRLHQFFFLLKFCAAMTTLVPSELNFSQTLS